jgi:hypothetical protein
MAWRDNFVACLKAAMEERKLVAGAAGSTS